MYHHEITIHKMDNKRPVRTSSLCLCFDVLQRNFRRTFREIESSYTSSSSRPAYNRLKLKMMFEEIVRQTFGI